MKLLALLLLLVLSGHDVQAQTGSATLSCTGPMQNADGSAFSAAQLPLTVKFFEGTAQGAYPNSSPGQAACAYVWTQLSPGLHYFVAAAIDKLGNSSAMSMSASKLVAGAPPNPPTIPQPVTSAGLVFTLQVTDDSLVLPQVGTVQAGKPCDPTQQIAFLGKTYMLVPKASVVPLAGMQVIAAWSDTCH